MLGASRVIVVVFCIAFVVGGLALAVAFPGEGGIFSGMVLAVIGVGGIVALAFERMRYHSEADERPSDDPARAGGDPPGTRLPPSFRRTDEVFVDPSSGVTMRVWFDPSSGERRYVAEGIGAGRGPA
ncbi:MAG: hypothetical protein MUE82_06455 [Chloroflexi bacterium]|nr:hypothetical protein [Chloroflexota bacterium]